MVQALSGLLIIIFVEGETEAFAIDVRRSYPGRTPTEPDTEKVVRGAEMDLLEKYRL